MNVVVWLIGFFVFLYTIGYARVVYTDGNKVGGIFITVLSISILVLPYWVTQN